VGKRSPILGYNHNVRYRGLVFHVQTEDSGVLSPHLFTHLFHAGVIVSTRKLVYDAGSAEDSIKSLMQAQHKAALKDLRRGHFDDKIDAYLGGTPGLLPRGVEEAPERAGESDLAPPAGAVEELAIGAPTDQQVAPSFEEASTPVPPITAAATPPAVSAAPAAPAAKPPQSARPLIPPVPPRPATERPLVSSARSAPALVDTTQKTPAPRFDAASEEPEEPQLSPELELAFELEDEEAVPLPRRAPRDTARQHLPERTRPTLDVRFNDHTRPTVSMSDLARPTLALNDHTRPTVSGLSLGEEVRRAPPASDGVPGPVRPSSPAIPPLPGVDSRRLGDRPQAINAAALPPARPIARPPSRPALTLPPVISRPATADDRARREADAAEAYAAAAPPAELPPGERPGQYAQHKKGGVPRIATEAPRTERSGPVPIPAGLGRPLRVGTPPSGSRPSAPLSSSGAAPTPIPREAPPPPAAPAEPAPAVARTPTPARISPAGPTTGRPGALVGSGVVMTRPAVIVGAPSKSVGTVPRIRKAREDEGRGFGQGLISEKSLDEVILAYLSEDADDK